MSNFTSVRLFKLEEEILCFSYTNLCVIAKHKASNDSYETVKKKNIYGTVASQFKETLPLPSQYFNGRKQELSKVVAVKSITHTANVLFLLHKLNDFQLNNCM